MEPNDPSIEPISPRGEMYYYRDATNGSQIVSQLDPATVAMVASMSNVNRAYADNGDEDQADLDLMKITHLDFWV